MHGRVTVWNTKLWQWGRIDQGLESKVQFRPSLLSVDDVLLTLICLTVCSSGILISCISILRKTERWLRKVSEIWLMFIFMEGTMSVLAAVAATVATVQEVDGAWYDMALRRAFVIMPRSQDPDILVCCWFCMIRQIYRWAVPSSHPCKGFHYGTPTSTWPAWHEIKSSMSPSIRPRELGSPAFRPPCILFRVDRQRTNADLQDKEGRRKRKRKRARESHTQPSPHAGSLNGCWSTSVERLTYLSVEHCQPDFPTHRLWLSIPNVYMMSADIYMYAYTYRTLQLDRWITSALSLMISSVY